MESLPSHKFKLFDLTIESDVPFYGIAKGHGKEDLWVISRTAELLDESRFQWIHTWRDENGQEVAACAKSGSDYLLRFPGLADFEILFEQQSICVYKDNFCSKNTLDHLLLDQVIPRYVCHLGRMVAHVSAVELANGRVVAFSGDSGQGKSTLAASFVGAGSRLLTDDCLLLVPRGDVVIGIPAYPSLRLWPESMAVLFPGAKNVDQVSQNSQKQQMLFAGDDGCDLKAHTEVDALFILDGRPGDIENGEVSASRAGGMDAVMALAGSTFALDVVSREFQKQNFDSVSAVLAAGLPLYRLNYEREFSLLPKVRDVVTRLVE